MHTAKNVINSFSSTWYRSSRFPTTSGSKANVGISFQMKDSPGLTVHIVIFIDTVHKAFDEMKGFLEQSICKSSPFGTEFKQPPMPAYQPQKGLSICGHKNNSSQVHTCTGFLQSTLQTTLSDNKFNINGVHVTVETVLGDLTDQTCDVIVNSTGLHMKSTHGVSGAILKKGGPEFVKAWLTQVCTLYFKMPKHILSTV